MICKDASGSTPELVRVTKRLVSLAVMIFGKFPFSAFATTGIRLIQSCKHVESTLTLSLAHEAQTIETSNHRPESAIVIEIGLIFDFSIKMTQFQGIPTRVIR